MQPIVTIKLDELEHHFNHLLRSFERLKLENDRLRQEVANQTREKLQLIKKNLQAAQKIKN